MTRPAKRPRLDEDDAVSPALVREQRAAFLSSLNRGISPPPGTRAPAPATAAKPHESGPNSRSSRGSFPVERKNGHCTRTKNSPNGKALPPSPKASVSVAHPTPSRQRPRIIPSPFKLTRIRGLPLDSNIDTVSLHEILGDPLIKEAWVFNFCFDIDWMMHHFDPDVRSLVKVKIIHGSWKREDGNRVAIDDACSRWPNVEASVAYLPDPFGTHHSKMFVLFNHADQAEVIIHTANMLVKDWTNMTQAVWRSGALEKAAVTDDGEFGTIGSGSRFKYDLLAYLKAYKRPTQELVKQLAQYDFCSVKGALVASVPSRITNTAESSTPAQHLWGYPQLRETVRHIKKQQSKPQSIGSNSFLVAQMSSIATLHNGWLGTLVKALNGSPSGSDETANRKCLAIVFPTAPNVARSLDGYASGGSIHTKAQSAAHLKQIDSLRPYLNQWTGSSSSYQSHRDKAAPHIKTYIQFSTEPTREALDKGDVKIRWALLTSANLSTQAWGSLPRVEGQSKTSKTKSKTRDLSEGIVHIQSFEIGVLVWPELFGDGVSACMVPAFGKDTPDESSNLEDTKIVVGLRMPYDLPLTPYGPTELPWSPQGSYSTPDSLGKAWA